jgi:hypothetical protein
MTWFAGLGKLAEGKLLKSSAGIEAPARRASCALQQRALEIHRELLNLKREQNR